MKKTPTHLVYSTRKVSRSRKREEGDASTASSGAVATAAPPSSSTTRETTAASAPQVFAMPIASNPDDSTRRVSEAANHNLEGAALRRTSSARERSVSGLSTDSAPPDHMRSHGRSSSEGNTRQHRAHSHHHSHQSHRSSSRRSSRPGERSIKQLRPSPPLLQSDHISVAQCVKTMVDKKREATLLIDQKGLLTGILTDRDIAVKVVALGKDPKTTRVSEVMTPNPLCVESSASAIDALNKMVSGQFRHLPVADNDKVVGILDIAKCLYEAIVKMEHQYNESSDRLSEEMKKWGKHFRGGHGDLFERLREKLFLPTLSAILLERSPVPVLRPTSNALDAAQLMLTKRTSAVMVCNENDEMVGIFTSKDLMRRVVAMDLSPADCNLDSVMTPNPFSARLSTTILETLHTMHNGKFLHVPVFDDGGKLVGLVDVLQATCAIVQQVQTLQSADSDGVKPLLTELRESFIQREDAVESEDQDDEESDRRDDYDVSQGDDNESTDGMASENASSWVSQPNDTKTQPESSDPLSADDQSQKAHLTSSCSS
ncbi:hypothetical protein PINS_up003785 [Pythium insidiosum]|nr:hypothetical protein PINS_up003785 [Pythium insidiosum]